MQRFGFGRDRIALSRVGRSDEDSAVLVVEGPNVNGDDPWRGTAPHDPARSLYVLDG